MLGYSWAEKVGVDQLVSLAQVSRERATYYVAATPTPHHTAPPLFSTTIPPSPTLSNLGVLCGRHEPTPQHIS